MNNLASFFARSQGKWISQRTTYELSSKYMDSLQSEIKIEADNSFSPLIVSLNWKNVARQILDDIHNKNELHQNSKFNLRFTNILNTEQLVTLCTINDQSLISFKTRYGSTTIDETYWFVTNKLRLSTSIIKKFNTCVAVSFCSEIKV